MKILLVCTANICRSVMAGGIFTKLLSASPGTPAIRVQSAGIDALEGMAPDRNTSEVCSAHGIDIESHRARQLTKDMLKETDIALCMEINQKERILRAFPAHSEKIFLLKNYHRASPIEDASIEDPFGKPKKYYEECFDEIEQEVQRIIAFIQAKQPDMNDLSENDSLA